MKKILSKVLLSSAIFATFFISFITLITGFTNNVYAAGCTYSGPNPAKSGDSFSITYTGFAAGERIGVWEALGGSLQQNLGLTADTLSFPQTLNSSFSLSGGSYSVMIQTRYPVINYKCSDITITGSTGTSPIGTITAPAGIPNPPNATIYTEGLIRNGISILIIVAFLAMFLWTIFAGFRFVTSGGDEKTVGQAWSSIYWGIIGMLVVVGSYAIVKLVEVFFNVDIITGGLRLP